MWSPSPTASAASPASSGRRRAKPCKASSACATPRRSARPTSLALTSSLSTSATTRSRSGARGWTRWCETIREFAPDVLITHTDIDPFNPDHPAAHHAVQRARALAAGAGVASAFAAIRPPELFLFEPHQPELCNFTPTTFLDITPVFEAKREAMEAMTAQRYLQTYYAQRAEQRANHARRACGDPNVRFAEAFQRVLPQVVDAL